MGSPSAHAARHAKAQQVSEDSRLFAAYLRQRPDLRFEHEVLDHGRRPDFTVHGPLGAVICEVYNPELRLVNRVGSFDPVKPVRGAFGRRKSKQGAGAKSRGVPYVVVVGRLNSDVPFDEHDLLLAAFGSNRRLGPAQNTRYSAIAVVSVFNPTQWRLDAALTNRLCPGSSLRATWRTLQDVVRELRSVGYYDPDARVARLRVVHNPWAAVRLDLGWFGGPHDEQFVPDITHSAMPLLRISEGWRISEIPRP